jgi:ABC-type uncharacterized transport system substrate-binding protein
MRKCLVLLVCILLLTSFSTLAFSSDYQGKKILFIDSYHEGYGWSDGITKGVETALEGSGVELKIVRMDTKRNADEAFKREAALKAKAVIEEFKPDVVIAADDNASKFLIVPYYKDADLPFVFCGVNWDASVYGYPFKNVTGMVEVAPAVQLLEQIKAYAKGDRIGFLAPDILTARKEVENYRKVLGLEVVDYFAKDFDDWKKGFTELQGKVDMLIIDSDGGLYSDRADEMKAFVEANTRIPTGVLYDFMAPYALMGFAKVAEEQGAWAATTALKILDGASADSIPITQNKEGALIINIRIAKAMGLDIPFELIESAGQVIE